MQIPIASQAEYDRAVKDRRHIGNELVLQDTPESITVRTDVTVGRNGRCKTDDRAAVTVTARENAAVTAGGKATVIGHDSANVTAKGHCKVSLKDSAVGNCHDHCHITLEGKASISADGHCTIHAHDESSVSASGSSKVFTYQKAVAKGTDAASLSGKDFSTLAGQKKCSITAQDSCIVYATDDCTVHATDNCLVVAEKNTMITTEGSCVVMSKDSPNISVAGQSEHLNLDMVTDKNIMGTIKQLANTKAFTERPYVALQVLKENLPQGRKEAVDRRLSTMGLKDPTSTKNYLYNLIEADTGIKPAQSTPDMGRQLEVARKAGYVQGVCECVTVIGDDHALGKKLLTEMNVTKDVARKYANPETYKAMEKGIFAEQQKLEQTHTLKR